MGSGADQASLVALLQSTGRLTSQRVADVLRRVDRRFFVAPDTLKSQIYMASARGGVCDASSRRPGAERHSSIARLLTAGWAGGRMGERARGRVGGFA